MPIYNLAQRKQLVGKAGNIRKGVKSPVLDGRGKPRIDQKTGEIVTRPKEVEYFVFKVDEADPKLTAQVQELYNKPKMITAFLASNDKDRAWDYWMEAYNFNQLIARSDGNIVTFLFDTETNQKIIDRGRIVEVPTKQTAVSELLDGLGVGDMLGYYEGMVVSRTQSGKPVFFDAAGRLNVILMDLKRQLYWTVHTGGLYGDVPHITEMVDNIHDLAQAMGIQPLMIPFTLTRYEVERSYSDDSGKKHKRKGWDIRMEVLPNFFSGALEAYKNTPLALAATNPTPRQEPPNDYVDTEPPFISDDVGDAGIAEDELAEPPISQAIARESNEPECTPKFLVSEGIVGNEKHAAALMALLGIPDGAPAGASLERIGIYNQWRENVYTGKNKADREKSAEMAIAGARPF